MARRMLHGVMALAFLTCIASLIQTSLTHSIPCPDCGTAMIWIDAGDQACEDPTWRLLDMYHCQYCEYDVIMAAKTSER